MNLKAEVRLVISTTENLCLPNENNEILNFNFTGLV